ncbi:Urease gamma/beta subunit (Urea amidohydrolase gamma/beta subunit) [Mesorhizobium plurifarium]|uniref:urease n=1 Tax=Mesorhizobium plurifarium TaxID=69974 RepID=A0A090EB14_MESPL|nr:Urease gamma/beta subunit (Urea amidohydrolase gamma/beta subunit) [Mesorhizobium plurifarium]
MMNLSPTEMDRLVIFNAAQIARRNMSLGIRLSHPEAVAYLTDEVMTAARRDMGYAEIRDMATRLLTAADVEPGVPEMIPMLYIECLFAEGTKVIVLFDPIAPPAEMGADHMVPGEIVSPSGTIEMFADLPVVTMDVVNTGDRDIQVRSHTHFFETNRALKFDRAAAWGMKLDRPAGTGVRFEPGVAKSVRLVPIAGDRHIRGQAGLVNGFLDAPHAREKALELARARGYLGA